MEPHCGGALCGSPDSSSSPLHGDSLAYGGTDEKAGIRYTKEKLLSLRPAQELNAATAAETAGEESDSVLQDPAKAENPNSLDEQDPREEASCDILDQIPEKKKKKKKRSGKNRKPVPTGFEEFYADPPITPEEYQIEVSDLYHPSRSFIERMELCIQRYRARRKFDSVRSNIFTKYLVLGGVDSGVKSFGGGIDEDTLETSTAAEIAEIRASDYIRGGGGSIKFYNAEDPNWVIDFEGVVKGFFSQKVPQTFTTDTVKEIKEYSAVIRNFLNYVLSHSVCPEYTREIMAARKICDLAEVELPLIRELGNLLPGDFNTAASTLYGGYYSRLGIQNFLWIDNDLATDPQRRRRLYGMLVSEAERIFKTAIAFLGTWEHYQSMMGPYEEAVKSASKSMEVVEIILPTPETRKKYAGVKDLSGDAGNFQPLGVLKVKHWDNPDALEEDTTDDGQSATETSLDSVTDEFWLESHILEKCFVGMKFEAIVHELSMGVKYFDVVNNIYCSFFTYLPSSRLDGWRAPVLNERPAPTVDDADNNDGQLEGEKEDGLD